MLRSIAMAAALAVTLGGMASAGAATYCASYVGGQEKAGARSQCVFATLSACRSSVRHRGGGHCYMRGMGPTTAKK
jgi:hypothetical protein